MAASIDLTLVMAQLAAIRNQVDAAMMLVDQARDKHVDVGAAALDDEGDCTHPPTLNDGSQGRVETFGGNYFCKTCGATVIASTSQPESRQISRGPGAEPPEPTKAEGG